MAKDLTLEVLKEIREEARKTNTRLDQTNTRLEQLGERIDRLESRQSGTETRLASELVAVVAAVDRLRDLLVDRLDLRDKVANHENRIALLEQQAPH